MSGLRRKAIVATGVLAIGAAAWSSTGTAATERQGGEGDRWWKPPADVRRMLDDVDSRSLERYDRALVSFGTRHTLSTQDDPRRGIGAARDYIKRQFDQIATTSGGRMSVELQSYVQPPASRIPTATTITNVVATLRGTDPRPTGCTSSALTTTRASPTCWMRRATRREPTMTAPAPQPSSSWHA